MAAVSAVLDTPLSAVPQGARPSAGAGAVFTFGTKAETLERLAPLVRRARVLDLLYFGVEDWRADRSAVLARIAARFGAIRLAVRSSAAGEDGADNSQAGAYTSRLDVDGADPGALEEAVSAVIASYPGNPLDQVLVQPMLVGVSLSGVITTHDMERGSPFYVLNYDDESGQTDSITGGTGVNKAVLVFRDADDRHIESKRVAAIVEMARELESIGGPVPLDIEFAMTGDGAFYLFQVRRISLRKYWLSGTGKRVSKRLEFVNDFIAGRSRPRRGLAGSRTILGIMPDWNPAEIIGTTPRPLARSLYRELVTRSVWSQGRERMGYRALPSEELMVMIGGHPYIDVRNSFNSFLPSGLPEAVAGPIVDAWLGRLDDHPEMHDKIEFEIAHTCLDLTFDESFAGRYGELLGTAARADFRDRLRALTARCLDSGPEGTLGLALGAINNLVAAQSERDLSQAKRLARGSATDLLLLVADLIEECRKLGTLPFSIIARHAFIAEALLRSAVARGALSDERLAAYKRSIHTVTGELTADFNAVCRGELAPRVFFHRYGHLRPGTYDIMSLRYDERDDLFAESVVAAAPPVPLSFALSAAEADGIDRLMAEAGLDGIGSAGLIEYARRAIAGREYAKFVFTRNLSDALHAMADWGERLGLGRDDLSHIDLGAILAPLIDPLFDDSDLHFLDLAERGRRGVAMAQTLKLSYLIRDSRDTYVVPLHRSAANFIGATWVEGRTVLLDAQTPASIGLFGKIVCIENADPGYDWIFTKGIKGLVTKYGGVNSHMAIRCAEFGLPAAIGCGERTFERLLGAGRVELNCADKIVRPAQAD